MRRPSSETRNDGKRSSAAPCHKIFHGNNPRISTNVSTRKRKPFHMIRRSEIRKDFIVDRYVIISPRRNLRPHQYPQTILEGQHSTTKQAGVFCPHNIDHVKPLAHVGPAKERWKMKVIKNIFPAVSLDNP